MPGYFIGSLRKRDSTLVNTIIYTVDEEWRREMDLVYNNYVEAEEAGPEGGGPGQEEV